MIWRELSPSAPPRSPRASPPASLRRAAAHVVLLRLGPDDGGRLPRADGVRGRSRRGRWRRVLRLGGGFQRRLLASPPAERHERPEFRPAERGEGRPGRRGGPDRGAGRRRADGRRVRLPQGPRRGRRERGGPPRRRRLRRRRADRPRRHQHARGDRRGQRGQALGHPQARVGRGGPPRRVHRPRRDHRRGHPGGGSEARRREPRRTRRRVGRRRRRKHSCVGFRAVRRAGGRALRLGRRDQARVLPEGAHVPPR